MRAALFLLLVGCSAEPSDTADACADLPELTYENWGEGFLTENCQGCHASTTDNRYYAPESVVFDTVEDAWSWRERILTRAVDKDPSPMPPAGGVLEDDLQRLIWWLECGEEGS